MSKYIPISPIDHGQQHWLPGAGYAFAAREQVAPILLAEVAKLIPNHVLAFVARGDGFQPVAMLSLGQSVNLYLDPAGKWSSGYVPAVFRGFPFALGTNSAGEKILCIDESRLTRDAAAPRLFKAGVVFDDRILQISDFLHKCEQDRQATADACKQLQQYNLIKPWPLRVPMGGTEVIDVGGLYCLDEKALNDLPAEDFATLRQSGALMLAYGMIFSSNQVAQLVLRAKLAAQRPVQKNRPISLSDVFPEEEAINFGFLGGI